MFALEKGEFIVSTCLYESNFVIISNILFYGRCPKVWNKLELRSRSRLISRNRSSMGVVVEVGFGLVGVG